MRPAILHPSSLIPHRPFPLHSPPPTATVDRLGCGTGVETEHPAHAGEVFSARRIAAWLARVSETSRGSLHANETARVVAGRGPASQGDAGPRFPRDWTSDAFARRMPASCPSSAGCWAKSGRRGSALQLFARSDDPGFQPCPGVVRRLLVPEGRIPSRGISIAANSSSMPGRSRTRSATTFDVWEYGRRPPCCTSVFAVSDHLALCAQRAKRAVPEHPAGSTRRSNSNFARSAGRGKRAGDDVSQRRDSGRPGSAVLRCSWWNWRIGASRRTPCGHPTTTAGESPRKEMIL